MNNSATYLLERKSGRGRPRNGQFSGLHPKRLRNYEEIVCAARKARINDRWIAQSASLAASVLKAAAEVNKRLGFMLILGPIEVSTAMALSGCFRNVASIPRPKSILPAEELVEVLNAQNKDELFIGGSVDLKSQTVTLWRGDGRALVVLMDSFRASGDGTRPNFNEFSVADYGHTLRFGKYESSAEAVLYEHDSEFRKKIKTKRRGDDRGFGPSLRRLRIQKGLRQSDFPNVPPKTVARIERGEVAKPRGRTLTAIAEKLNVLPKEIETF